MSQATHVRIADHSVIIEFANENTGKHMDLLPSFSPFIVNTPNEYADEETLFKLTIDDSLIPISKSKREHIGIFETGNGRIVVDAIEGGGYQYILRDIHSRNCCMLQTNKDFSKGICALTGGDDTRSFGLNNALMMMFAFRGSYFQTLLVHASLVRNNGYGYAFIAKSGTGKSTHTALWLKHIDGCDLMNDDNPIVRIINGEAIIYGSPWSGKTPCYKNTKAPLKAITKIDRAKKNSVEKLSPTIAFSYLMPACSTMKWDKVIYGNICDTVINLIESNTGMYVLHCTPEKEAALVCYDAIAVK